MTHRNCHCVVCAGLTTAGNLDPHISSIIEKNGWAIIPVKDPKNPNFMPFHYTIGLTETFQSAEIIIVGNFSTDLIGGIIASIVDQIKINSKILDDEEIGQISKIKSDNGSLKSVNLGCRVAQDLFKELCCGRLIDRYGKDAFRLRQVILPDEKGKLPWHKDFNVHWSEHQASQILLYVSAFHINPVKECHKCYIRDVKSFKCSGCMKIEYCSVSCQKADWKTHKLQCKKQNNE